LRVILIYPVNSDGSTESPIGNHKQTQVNGTWSPLIYKLIIFAISFYWNYIPDSVNINDNKWKKVFSFTTVKKKIKVNIYGRKGIVDSISPTFAPHA
jgi:hypothetical protein